MADELDLGIIDLTTVAAPDIRVKMKCADDTTAIYRVPGNAPSGLMIEMLVLLREVDKVDPEDIELVADLRIQLQEKVDELFTLRNADYAIGDIKLGDEELAFLVHGLFQRYYDSAPPAEGDEGGDRPTGEEEQAETPSSTSTPPRRRSGQPSRPRSPQARAPSPSSTSSPT